MSQIFPEMIYLDPWCLKWLNLNVYTSTQIISKVMAIIRSPSHPMIGKGSFCACDFCFCCKHFRSESRWDAKILLLKCLAMNGVHNYLKNIKMYVLRCTTIGLKQECGHKTSRRADQVEAGPLFSGHWIPYLFFRTSSDIIGYLCCPDFFGHVRHRA